MAENTLVSDVLRQATPQDKLELFEILIHDIQRLYSHDHFLKHEPKCKTDTFILTYLSLDYLLRRKLFEKAALLLNESFIEYFYEKDEIHENILSKIVRRYYLVCKKDKVNTHSPHFYFKALYSSNKNGLKELSSILTNVCLDILVSSNQIWMLEPYFKYDVLPQDKAARDYFEGVFCLINGSYKKAFDLFENSEMMASNAALKRKVRKFHILACLFTNNLKLLEMRKWKTSELPYYRLYLSVKKGCERAYKATLERFSDVFLGDRTYFIVRKLFGIVLMETLRKIGIVYSAISLENVSKKLNIDIDALILLMTKNIRAKVVYGVVEKNIFISKEEEKKPIDFRARIADSLKLSQTMSRLISLENPLQIKLDSIEKGGLSNELD